MATSNCFIHIQEKSQKKNKVQVFQWKLQNDLEEETISKELCIPDERHGPNNTEKYEYAARQNGGVLRYFL